MFFAATLTSGCLAHHRGPMPGEPAGASFVEAQGARVRYLDVGKGPVVVLLHGYGSALDAWAGVIPDLSKDHRVIALDLKGFGWTDRPEGDYSPAAQARLVLAVLDARGVGRVRAMVGHSWGASVAMSIAMSEPDRVESLALYDAFCFEEQIPSFFVWARASGVGETLFSMYYTQRADERLALAFHDRRLVTEKLVEDVERALQRPGTVAGALAAARGIRYREMQQRYATIAQPVLLQWGREDRVTPLRDGERLKRLLPHARLVVHPKCGHLPMVEKAAESNAELRRFLEEIAPAMKPQAKARRKK